MIGKDETIIALATPLGHGSVGIVRLSGSHALPLAASLCTPSLPSVVSARHAFYREFRDRDGRLLDKGLLLFFPAPYSLTGENVVELHLHGSPYILHSVTEYLIRAGARQAVAGEFSRRAFLNGKMDLTQAEAVADLINSETESAARAALQSLQGDFSQRLQEINKELMDLRVFVEAALDFPQEEIDFLADQSLTKRIEKLMTQFEVLIRDAYQGSLVNEVRQVVLLGEVNAGKSSLLNALSKKDRAIVSRIPGTTRDFIQESVNIGGMHMLFTDTAGIRMQTGSVEEEGIRRAWRQATTSDMVILLFDVRRNINREMMQMLAERGILQRTILLANKIDLLDEEPFVKLLSMKGVELPLVRLSVKTGAGLDLLQAQLLKMSGYRKQTSRFSVRRHQLDKIKEAQASLRAGYEVLKERGGGELLAEDLKQASVSLGEILGEHSSEELLDKIFAGFCIGK